MRNYLLVPIMMLAALVACTKPEDQGQQTAEATVTLLSESNVAVPVDGDIVTIKFKATDAWTALSSADWLTLSAASGQKGDACTIKASAVKNETNDVRTAKVTITCGKAKAEVTVTQAQVNALNIKVLEYEVDADGGEVEVEVEANVEYTVTIPDAIDWVHDAAAKGMTTSKVTLIVDPTEETEVREAYIKISSGDLSSSIKISQKPFVPYFDYTGDWADMQWSFYATEPTMIPQEGADIVIGVDTNIEWRVFFSVWSNEAGAMVDVMETDWAHLSYDVEKSEIHLVIDANETYLERVEYLYAECMVGGKVSQEYGGLAKLVQPGLEPEAGAYVLWTELLGDIDIPAAHNRLAFTESGALLVSDGTQIHAVNPEDGSYYKAISWTGITPTSIDVDDAGNIIIADNVDAEEDWSTYTLISGQELKIYYTKDVNETPHEMILPNGLYGTVGSIRARGDLSTKGAITGFAGGSCYWFGYDIENYAPVGNAFGSQHSGPFAGVNTVWTPQGATTLCYGSNLSDGVLYRGYDGNESVYYRKDAYTPQWYATEHGLEYEAWTLVTGAGSGGNENQNNMDIIDYDGRKIIAFTQGAQFSYGGNTDVYVVDVTNPESAVVLAVLDGSELDSVEAIEAGEEAWPGAYFAVHNGADVLLREEEGYGLVLYVVNSTTESLSKVMIVL